MIVLAMAGLLVHPVVANETASAPGRVDTGLLRALNAELEDFISLGPDPDDPEALVRTGTYART
jgi:hypothetical protein